MIIKEKFRLRKKIIALRNKLSPEERIWQSAIIGEKFFTLPQYGKAKIIGFYASKIEEVPTDNFIEKVLAEGKRVVLPRVNPGFKLIWHEIKNLKDLTVSIFAVREPKKNTPKVELKDMDLLIVPSVAFDRKGNRVGYGKGFYDRVLVNFSGKSIGLAFTCQIIDKVPREKHDKKVDKILIGE